MDSHTDSRLLSPQAGSVELRPSKSPGCVLFYNGWSHSPPVAGRVALKLNKLTKTGPTEEVRPMCVRKRVCGREEKKSC